MAEIPIQRKEGRGWLTWVLLLIVLLGAAWYFWTRSAGPAATRPADSTATAAPGSPNSTIVADSAAASRAAVPATRPGSTGRRP